MNSSAARAGPKSRVTPLSFQPPEVTNFKAWRKQTADEENVPAYCVCSDAVMNAILSSMPQSTQALQAVNGMGPSKVAKYGAAILALCKGKAPVVSLAAPGERTGPSPPWCGKGLRAMCGSI
jgi:superfamily II DNA helicase RecQ